MVIPCFRDSSFRYNQGRLDCKAVRAILFTFQAGGAKVKATGGTVRMAKVKGKAKPKKTAKAKPKKAKPAPKKAARKKKADHPVANKAANKASRKQEQVEDEPLPPPVLPTPTFTFSF
jgi:hypothetical protein